MKHYFPPEEPVPPGIETPFILLEPLKPDHVEIDYAAVVESRDQLRLWSGSPWPRDDFTLDDNLKDLRWHWREHQERIAFTYTVLDPSRAVCLGCLYLRPLSELQPSNPIELAGVKADETIARFWIRTSRLKLNLDRHLLETLIPWLTQDWPFSRILFGTRQSNLVQVQLFDKSPLNTAMSLQMPQRGGTHIFYES